MYVSDKNGLPSPLSRFVTILYILQGHDQTDVEMFELDKSSKYQASVNESITSPCQRDPITNVFTIYR